ncbi:hypothetical protein GOODEAATRI_033140 [Goodea atripinnis]|uniref:Uncharacterized protein n=1 Tax=Goodea atripinnis TaxID=208336 RepID=A0ABV0Q309_9TELE
MGAGVVKIEKQAKVITRSQLWAVYDSFYGGQETAPKSHGDRVTQYWDSLPGNGMSSEAIYTIKTVLKNETGLFPRRRPANKIGRRNKLHMNHKTGDAAPLTILHYREDQPMGYEKSCN